MIFQKKLILKNINRRQKSMKKYPVVKAQEIIVLITLVLTLNCLQGNFACFLSYADFFFS